MRTKFTDGRVRRTSFAIWLKMEIGLKFLMSDISPDFKIGVIELNFQMDGTVRSFNKWLKINQIDTKRKDLKLKLKIPG